MVIVVVCNIECRYNAIIAQLFETSQHRNRIKCFVKIIVLKTTGLFVSKEKLSIFGKLAATGEKCTSLTNIILFCSTYILL